ncbi:YoaK family protein [Streptomyces sp. I6]|uniref:YoaK family protein n=1 Tax=Streptomyces sp. I6 TaxID=2483113 RepID=UPI000F450890|nr:YoaK family protein [Streptomyces sp. I6]RNL70526.1 DUF1275 domain-containing protein [Streptomyces sp. I6]
MLGKRPGPVGPPKGLMVLLTAVAGWVDAAAYTGPSRVFVANQTGNAVFLAARLAERSLHHPDLRRTVDETSGPLASICGFCAGVLLAAVLGHRSLRGLGRAWRALVAGRWFLLVVEAALLVIAAGTAGPHQVPVLLIAAAMGVQSLYAARVALQGAPTTTLTSTLVALITRAVQDRGRAARRGVRLLSLVFLAYMLGAAGGAAVTLTWSYSAAHAIAAVVLTAAAVAIVRADLTGRGTAGDTSG